MKDISPWNRFHAKANASICTEEGLMCRNCNQAILCIGNGDGGFNEIDTETCNSSIPETCLNGLCTIDSNPGCVEQAKIIFPCNNKGMFPDPFDCRKYYICCTVGKSEISTCDKDHAYDPLTTYCKTPLPNSTCTNTPLPTCIKAGQLGSLTINPSIYYICQLKTTTDNKKVLYPMQYLCPNGKKFEEDHCV